MGGGGGKQQSQVIGYWYKLGVQIAVAHAPTDHISELVFGERTAWTGNVRDGKIKIDAKELYGGEKVEGGVYGTVYVHSGQPNQEVNPYVKAARGQTSAQRGLLTLVFGDVGEAPKSDIRTINFNMSTMSEKVEQELGYKPTGILTTTDVEMTKAQANTYIQNFYDKIKPYQEKPWQDLNRDGKKGQYVDPLEEQKKIYGSYRAVALMYAYRAFVLNNLNGNKRHTYRTTPEKFFGTMVKDESVNMEYSEPFTWSAMSPYFKSIWVRVQNIYQGWTGGTWYPDKAEIDGTTHITYNGAKVAVRDMNPAHIIYKIMTNSTWGMGYNRVDLDEASFKKAADTLYDEKFGLSYAWRKEETIEDFIGKVLDTIDGALRINVLTGKFELILMRNDYKEDDLYVLDENAIIEMTSFSRSAWGDTPNEIVVTYKDRNEQNAVVTVQNLSAIAVQGSVVSSAQTYEGVHEADLAIRIAQRELQVVSNPLAKVTLKVNRLGFLLQHGDVFLLKWKPLDIVQIPFRVISVTRGEFDDGTLVIEAVEDLFGMSKQAYSSSQPTIFVEDNSSKPIPVKTTRLEEIGIYDMNAIGGSDIVAKNGIADNNSGVLILAEQPNDYNQSYDVIGANTSFNFDAIAPTLRTSNPFTAKFQLADDVNYRQDMFSINYLKNKPDIITKDMYILIDNERMIIKSVNPDGEISVYRGAQDTIPEEHRLGTIGWIISPYNAVDQTLRIKGETAYYKLLTNTQRGRLVKSQANLTYIELGGRAARPYPPAGVSLNNVYFPEKLTNSKPLKVSWYNRNRKFEAGSLTWYDGNSGVEENTTYNLQVYDAETDVTLFKKEGITPSEINQTIPVPITSKAITLDGDGLAYLFDFSKSVTSAVAGNAQPIPLKTPHVIYSDVTKSNVAHFDTFDGCDYLKFPATDLEKKRSFTLGFAYRCDYSGYVGLFTNMTNGGSYASDIGFSIWQNSYNLYIDFRFIGNHPPIFRFPMGERTQNKYVNCIVVFNRERGVIELWLDGEKVKEQFFGNALKHYEYDPNGAVNLWRRDESVKFSMSEYGSELDASNNALLNESIPVKPNTQYRIQAWVPPRDKFNELNWCFKASNKTVIGYVESSADYTVVNGGWYVNKLITTPANATTIGVCSYGGQHGHVMVTEGASTPAYNPIKDDTPSYYDKGEYVYVGRTNNNNCSDSSTTMAYLYVYDGVLSDEKFKKLVKNTVNQKWPPFVGVRLYSKRDGLESWQKYDYVVPMVD